MRNFFSVMMVGLLLMGCSVDNDETIVEDDQLLIANSVLNVDGCESVSYNLNNGSGNVVGQFTITNDKDNLYLNFKASSGLSITEIAWEVAMDVEGLPANNGGIIYGQLENKQSFSSGIDYYGETLSLDNFEKDLVVAARVTFVDSKQQKVSVWVGDQLLGKKGSKFLFYSICEPQDEPVCLAYAGADNSISYTYKELDALVNTVEDVENLYKSLLEDGVSRSGTFSPTIKDIVKFASIEANRYGDLITIYTVTNELNGETCSDSVELTLTVTR